MIIDNKIFEDVVVIEESDSWIKARANKVVTIECKGGETFSWLLSTFSEERRGKVQAELDSGKIGPVLAELIQNVYIKNPPIWYYVVTPIIWFLTITLYRPGQPKVPAMKPGLYDTGIRIPMELIISKNDIKAEKLVA